MALTLNELYALENNVFRGMFLPTFKDDKHYTFLRRDTIFENILLECGHFETLYTSPTNFNRELAVWSRTRCSSWEDLFRTTIQQYELVHNYDRVEEWEEKREHSESGENSERGTNERTDNGTSVNNYNSNRNDELSVSAYNGTASYQPKEKNAVTDGGEADILSEYETEQIDTRDGNFSRSSNDKFSRTVRAYGNIGVTTAQQMLREEREIALFSIVQHITKEFKDRFCVMIY